MGVEVDFVGWVLHHRIEVGGVFFDGGLVDQGFELGLIAAHQNGVGHDDFFGADFDAALFDDGVDGTQQVLVGAHASGDAVHDDADAMCFHDLREFETPRRKVRQGWGCGIWTRMDRMDLILKGRGEIRRALCRPR